MERYELNDNDKKLIEIGLDVLEKNFDDGVYNHTVGCAILCKNGNIYKSVNCDVIHGSCAEINTTRRRNKIFFGLLFVEIYVIMKKQSEFYV